MAQSREVYLTSDPEINRILQRISDRLDLLEGLRPDLGAGLLELEADKDLIIRAAGAMASQSSAAVAITGGTIDGTTIGATTASTASFTKMQVDDSNDETIHQVGETA